MYSLSRCYEDGAFTALVTLTMIHERAPPTLDDGALPTVDGGEDDRDFVEFP
ncbi:hypothetical protein A2U01_0025811 [Trifolium medium]|uniref:Uncharacterized protein n=1 Tax=Trifolium medium TaxID=97028 RepID=A0A392NZ79_9FABA|nr:hypothetical protein [Trifolium medium]